MEELRVGMMVRVKDTATCKTDFSKYRGALGVIVGPDKHKSWYWNLDIADDARFSPDVLIPINPDNEAWGSWEDMMNILTPEKAIGN